jgi:hypothetical protein
MLTLYRNSVDYAAQLGVVRGVQYYQLHILRWSQLQASLDKLLHDIFTS